jgi:hypothetical protein
MMRLRSPYINPASEKRLPSLSRTSLSSVMATQAQLADVRSQPICTRGWYIRLPLRALAFIDASIWGPLVD